LSVVEDVLVKYIICIITCFKWFLV